MKLAQLMIAGLSAGSIFIASCGSGLLGTPKDKDMSTAEGLKSIKEKVTKAFGADKKVYSCQVSAKDHMSNEFGNASVHYLDNGKDMSQLFLTEPEEKVKDAEPATIQNETFLKSKQGSRALKDFNFDQIPGKVKEAEVMIPAEYEGFTLNHWYYDVDNDGKVTADFVIEGGKKGEKSKQQGRMIVTNYYEFAFTMDENGKVTMDE